MPQDRDTTLNDASKAAAGRNSHENVTSHNTTPHLPPPRRPPQQQPLSSSSPTPGQAITSVNPSINHPNNNAKNLSSHVNSANMDANNKNRDDNNPHRNRPCDSSAPRQENAMQVVKCKPTEASAESAANTPKPPHATEKSPPQAPSQAVVYVQAPNTQGRPPTPAAHPQDVHAYYHPSVVPSYMPPPHPHDSIPSHYTAHPHPGHWAPAHAPPPYTWVQAAPQPGQPAATHHTHTIHQPYEYHVGNGVGHVSVSHSPYPMPGAVWTSHPSYPTTLPVAGTHYAHYYPSPHPAHVQGHYPHPSHVGASIPSAVAEGSVAKHQQDSTPMAVQGKSVNGAHPPTADTQDKTERPTKNESKDLREKPGGPSKPDEVMKGSQKEATQNEENSANRKTLGAGPSATKETSSTKRAQNTPSVQQPIRKVRKPYTKTKNRESWSEKEHQLFLQALQLYNRDWKRIESFIGTKTVLQIRSHAQKHFSKVTKYKTGEYIPPPRPKRRASRPYPRSRGVDVPESTEKTSDTQNQKASEGAKTTSDSCAGSSENGNVSGNGKSSSNGSSNCVANSALPPGQRSSMAIVNSSEKNHSTREQQPQSGPSSSGFLTVQKSSNVGTVSPSMQCYNPYYYNTGRPNPNSLPYPPGYYQNHYSQPPVPVTQTHPFYACYDQNCSHYQTYQGHGHVHLTHSSLPPLHAQSTHSRVANQYPHQPTAGRLPPTAPRRQGENPAVKWADDAAARRAHRARIIRGRKTSTVKNSGQESDEAKEPEIIAVEDNKTGSSKPVDVQSGDKEARDSSGEKQATVASLLNSSQEPPRSNVLIGPNTTSSITGLIDVGSDEAVAGFSASDGQGSGSDGSPQEGQERSGTPEEDPNSSSGDDGRGRNTRGSSPTDPNSGGSREDTPCQNEVNGSRNSSPQDGVTPTESRETTPSENGAPPQGGKKCSDNTATDHAANGNMHLEAAEALLKYRNSGQPKTSTVSKTNPCRKAGINNLLNSSPQMVDVVPRPPAADQKRGRSPPNEVRSRESGGKGGTGRYKDEPSSQRRRHNSAEVEPGPNGRSK